MVKKKLKKIARGLYKEFQYRYYHPLFLKNKFIKNQFSGKRIFILGDGSSLNEIDLIRLKTEYTMGSNYLMTHKDFKKLNLSFYAVAASQRSIIGLRNNPTGNYENKLLALDEMAKTSSTKFFFDISMRKFINKNRLFISRDVFYVVASSELGSKKTAGIDITKPLSTMEGSLFFMVTLALYMGFTEIYLCGCGYTYDPQQVTHFYDQDIRVEQREIDPRLQWLKDLVVQKNGKIFNVVPNGFKSPVFCSVSLSRLETMLPSA